ncbi:MAG: Hsp20 family protein [Escherichia coli]|nr:Hsp20 family protein [Escherichia coli]
MRNFDLSPLMRQWIGFDKQEEKKWLHQGLMNQPFSLSFTLAENMEVSGATFVNGLLHIDLIRNEPEPIAAQRIAISERPALNS